MHGIQHRAIHTDWPFRKLCRDGKNYLYWAACAEQHFGNILMAPMLVDAFCIHFCKNERPTQSGCILTASRFIGGFRIVQWVRIILSVQFSHIAYLLIVYLLKTLRLVLAKCCCSTLICMVFIESLRWMRSIIESINRKLKLEQCLYGVVRCRMDTCFYFRIWMQEWANEMKIRPLNQYCQNENGESIVSFHIPGYYFESNASSHAFDSNPSSTLKIFKSEPWPNIKKKKNCEIVHTLAHFGRIEW